jgi:hypothetical protein
VLGDPGERVRWSSNGAQAAVMLRAIDNKDRWIATVDLAAAKLKPVHRLTDAAWVNWDNNDFGWLPDNRTLWYLSEESGYSHLYTQQGGRPPRALTRASGKPRRAGGAPTAAPPTCCATASPGHLRSLRGRRKGRRCAK